jgi:immune inhibitor A
VRRLTSGVLAGTLAAAVAATLAQQPALAAMNGNAPSQTDRGNSAAHRKDNRPGPLSKEQNELRAAAVQQLREGKADKQPQRGGGSTVTVGKKKSVEFFDNNSSARILTVLSEFGSATDPAYGGDAGPLHNQIPQPDRSKDNSTTWAPSFDTAHYNEMFNGSGESFKNYYHSVSGGVYTPEVTVEDWVTVPYNGAYYGSNPREDEGGAWAFIDDSADSWFTSKLKSLHNTKAVNDYLAQFDVWDRYDYDGDGNFNESDGYIDHFQAIHAGEGEEAGASPDAIWSHRWYVNATDFGKTGPTLSDGTQVLYGGARIGNSDYYIGDYTVEPENGGVGVFAHEYGHDLGLPDFYDTSGGDNGTGFWTLMSAGSWLGHGDEANEGIGTTPGLMGPDERLFLGWLDYETVDSGKDGTFTLAPAADPNASSPQAVVVNLPDKTTSTQYVAPKTGTYDWWSGRGDGLSNTLTRDVPAGDVSVSAASWYSIEQDYDYLYAEYSSDGGQTWKELDKLTGDSGGSWTTLNYSYTSDVPTLFRFRYQTDGGVNLEGAFLDDITLTAAGTSDTDGAESDTSAWTADGWQRVANGTVTVTTPQYYLLENRTYTGYDQTLAQGPYNFSEAITRPNWVEFFPYQDGMLVWYADKAYADNNTSDHPGHGQALPVDARPAPFYYSDRAMPGNRRQPFDATFGVQPTDHVTLHRQAMKGGSGKYTTYTADVPSNPGIPTFDDSDPDAYWSAKNPWGSTKVAGVGVTATVLSQDDGGNLVVSVTNPEQ